MKQSLKFLKVKLVLIFLAISVGVSNVGLAQEGDNTVLDDSIMDATIVLSTCLGGAVLGLSTLSFVEEPSDHLNNIIVGGAIGIIIGVGIVAFNQATKSKDMYYESAGEGAASLMDFSTKSRVAWHQESFTSNSVKPRELPQMQFSFNF